MKSIQEFYQKIDAQFTKIITREFCRKVALSLLCRGNLLVEDTHDIAESKLLKAIADLLNTTYAEVQLTPETSVALLENAFSHGLVLLKDITRCSPHGQVTLYELLKNAPNLQMVVATYKPLSSPGTYPLFSAQLDNFLLSHTPPYLHDSFVTEWLETKRLPSIVISQPIEPHLLGQAQKAVLDQYSNHEIKSYVIDIVKNTHAPEAKKTGVAMGASVKSAIDILRVAQGRAGLQNREYVIPDDIQAATTAVLSHRLSVQRPHEIGLCIEQILGFTPVPGAIIGSTQKQVNL